MAVIKAVSSKAGIGQALDYVTKEEKTEDKLVSGLHCEPDKVVCKRVYEVERILLILTPQKWGVIIVQKGKKNILII